jgi:hypothetical protein
MIEEIWSGWQSGADVGAIKAATKCGVKTGGYIPKGFKTEEGAKPEYKKLGAIETSTTNYAERTKKNIQNSDCTFIFYEDIKSPGTKLTFNMCERMQKPYLMINIKRPPEPLSIVKWLGFRNPKIINVAGHRESVSPGIELFVTEYLQKILKLTQPSPKESKEGKNGRESGTAA